MTNLFDEATEDQKPLDQMIIHNIGLTIDQIYEKANINDPDNPQFSYQYIEERIHSLIFGPQNPENVSNINLKKNNFCANPLSAREEYLILFLSKNLNRYTAADLCMKYRHLFGYHNSFSYLVRLVEKYASMPPDNQYSIVERYSSEIANLEKVCPLTEFTNEELAESGMTPEDAQCVNDILSSGGDNSININNGDHNLDDDFEETQQTFEEAENDFLAISQPRVKAFAQLITMENIAHIKVKNYLLGDATRKDLDFDMKTVDGYQADESQIVLVLIMLKNDLNFYLENVGDVIVKVNGFQIYPTETVCLHDRSLLEINGMDFAFNINRSFMFLLQETMKKIESGAL